MVFMVASLSAPYFFHMKKEHQSQIEQLSQSIISQKRYHISDIVNRTIFEIDFARIDVAKEYNAVCLEVCNILRVSYSSGNGDKSLSLAGNLKGVDIKSQISGYDNIISFVIFDSSKSRVVNSSDDVFAMNFAKELPTSVSDRDLYPSFASGISIDGFNIYTFISRVNVEKIVMNRMKDSIRAARLGEDGYIWINQILNYDGGDDYAIRLVHPNLPLTEGLKLSTKMEDIRGNLPYKAELEGVKKNGDLYLEYYFKKMNTETISHKLTYAKLYKPYDWVVATGVYLDDVDNLILQEQSIADNTYQSQIRMLGLLVLAIISVTMLALFAFEKQINSLINSYVGTIKKGEEALREEKNNVDKAFEQLKNVAYLDYLTGLLNRRAMYERINEEASRCMRGGSRFVLIICDIDYFKHINDEYGHDCGDVVLKKLSEVMSINIRIEDGLSRWGGEEFLILGTSCMINEGIALGACNEICVNLR